jgi:hypothetical protein
MISVKLMEDRGSCSVYKIDKPDKIKFINST